MALTVDLFKESACDGCAAVNVEVGRCAAKHYTKPAAGPSPVVPWAPEQLIDEVCQRRCKCNYLNQNKTVLCSATPCIPPQLPECKDEAAAPGYNYCSLCGPKYNKPITIDMFECELGDNKCPGPKPAPTRQPQRALWASSHLLSKNGTGRWISNCTKIGARCAIRGRRRKWHGW